VVQAAVKLILEPIFEADFEECSHGFRPGRSAHDALRTIQQHLIGQLNRHLRGWANYFKLGYPRNRFRDLNHFVRHRLGKHLRRRSQRGWRVRQGVSLYAHLEHLGLVAL